MLNCSRKTDEQSFLSLILFTITNISPFVMFKCLNVSRLSIIIELNENVKNMSMYYVLYMR